jgi:hypothetical protein
MHVFLGQISEKNELFKTYLSQHCFILTALTCSVGKMAERLFGLFYCQAHDSIIGLQHPNMDYATKCEGYSCTCVWREHCGFIILNPTNIVIYIEVSPDVKEAIQAEPTVKVIEKVVHHLYDDSNQQVQVNGFHLKFGTQWV